MKKIILTLGSLIISVVSSAKENAAHPCPFGFIENLGQIVDQNYNPNNKVKFLWCGNGLNVHLKGNSFSYELTKTIRVTSKEATATEVARPGYPIGDINARKVFSHRVDIELLGANGDPEIIASGKSSDYINFYTAGTTEHGVSSVHHYSSVLYRNIYPLIDVEFILSNDKFHPFKYNFIVHPGGKLSDIRIRYVGASGTSMDASGGISITTAHGTIQESIPESYLQRSGRKISVQYTHLGGDVYGVEAPRYSESDVLIVDPWATYFGGNDDDAAADVAIDSKNYAVISGVTGSSNNIASSGAHQTSYGGEIIYGDAFVAKFDILGNRLWSTYYGGSNDDFCGGVATDIWDNILVTGTTRSLNMATPSAFKVTPTGISDAYVLKLSPAGTRIWATYFGGPADEDGVSIQADANGNITITGNTFSTTDIATPNAHQTNYGGGTSEDAYLAQFDSAGVLQWATYYGGNDWEWVYDLAIDQLNNIFLTGFSYSSSGISTPGSFQEVSDGAQDAFIAKFSSSGQMEWGTYYGSHPTVGYSIVIDPFGNPVICGQTQATSHIATPNAHQPIKSGVADGFIAKFTTTGTRIWSTYYGGAKWDVARAVATDALGSIYVTGHTESVADIATPGIHQSTFGGGRYDALLVKFDSAGARLWGTYFGTDSIDRANGVAVDGAGNILMAGFTSSLTNLVSGNAHQSGHGGGENDAMIVSFNSSGTLLNLAQPLQKEHRLKVYPSPTPGVVYIETMSGTIRGSIQISDSQGKLLWSSLKEERVEAVDLSQYTAGVYFISFIDERGVGETVKILRQ